MLNLAIQEHFNELFPIIGRNGQCISLVWGLVVQDQCHRKWPSESMFCDNQSDVCDSVTWRVHVTTSTSYTLNEILIRSLTEDTVKMFLFWVTLILLHRVCKCFLILSSIFSIYVGWSYISFFSFFFYCYWLFYILYFLFQFSCTHSNNYSSTWGTCQLYMCSAQNWDRPKRYPLVPSESWWHTENYLDTERIGNT